MAISLETNIYLCDFCGIIIKSQQCPQILLPEGDSYLTLKFDNRECLNAWVMRDIMDYKIKYDPYYKRLMNNETEIDS